MKNLAIVCAILLVLPFLLAYIQNGSRKGIQVTISYYRYFAFFNVILSAIFVGGRIFFEGRSAGAVSGWAFSPIFYSYALALFSIALTGLFTVFCNGRIMLAASMCWSYFLVLSSALHVFQVQMHQIKDVSIILVHVAYNILVVLVLLRFIAKINRYYRSQQFA